MREQCRVCRARLTYGKGGNARSCAACGVKICKKCCEYGFCPAHYGALSPRGQTTVKRIYYGVEVFGPILLVVFAFTGALLSTLPVPLWFFVALIILVIFLVMEKSWLKSAWARDTARSAPAAATWQCPACGFENPPITHTCGQCGWMKAREGVR